VAESLQEIINRLYTAPEHAEWIAKTDVVALRDVQRWMASGDIEILGFTHALLGNGRFRIEPPLSLDEYIKFTKHYFERCFRENPDGGWSDSRHSAATDLVNIFAGLWRDPSVPRPILDDLKMWIEKLYKEGDADFRVCIIQVTLDHLFEQEPIRAFFSDWQKDAVLATAYEEACEWYKGGGRTRLGRPPFTEY
jgi:hypothetical protein